MWSVECLLCFLGLLGKALECIRIGQASATQDFDDKLKGSVNGQKIDLTIKFQLNIIKKRKMEG